MNYDSKLKKLQEIAIKNNFNFDYSKYPLCLSIPHNILLSDDLQKKTL